MPKNNYHPLPDLSSLIRWTVQDVINWLEKNKLSSCGKLFRDAGIDGNKLYNSTEADLIGINCPKKELSIIVDLLKQAQSQKGRGYKQLNPTPKAPPRPAATITNNDEASGSEDDCGWSDTEFSDEDDDGQNGDSDSSYEQPISEPAPPVRPSKPGGSSLPALPVPSRQQRAPAPPPQDSAPEVPPPRPGMRPIAQPSEEFYEEPNNDVPSRPTFSQPPLPGSRDRPPRPVERPPVSQTPPPQRGGRRPLPQPQPDDEVYEEPDMDEPPPSTQHQILQNRVLPLMPSKGRPQLRGHAGPTVAKDNDQDEFYMDPELSDIGTAPPPPSSKHQKQGYSSVPSIPTSATPNVQKPRKPNFRSSRATTAKQPVAEEDFYMDPEESESMLSQPSSTSRYTGMPSRAQPVPQDEYEEPDSKLQPTPRPPKPRIPPAPSEEDYVETDTPTPSVVARIPAQQRRPPAPIPTPSPVDDDQDNYLEMETNLAAGEDYDQPDVGFRKTSKDNNQKHSTSSVPSRGVKKTEFRNRKDPLPPTPQAASPIVPPQTRQAPTSTIPKSEDDESDLERQKWFHGDIKRASAAARLMQYKTDGMYLIRKSSQGKDKPYTLQIWYQDKDYNLPIRIVPHNKQYAIGAERPGERTFPTLRAMVNFFKKNFLVLAGGGQTTLVKSLPR